MSEDAIENIKSYFQTILLGDSGVGKTSLLVKFDTGKFQSGNFSATVGIGFTVIVLSYFIWSLAALNLNFLGAMLLQVYRFINFARVL